VSPSAWKATVVALVLATLITGGVASWVLNDGTYFAVVVAAIVILALAG